MPQTRLNPRVAASLLAAACSAAAVCLAVPARAGSNPIANDVGSARESPAVKLKPDLSGRKRVGVASFYAKMFTGRKMADGNRMDPNDDNAASRTLPLGTIAMVTNLETGRSAVVTIQDRGPYVQGRIVDLSPATAKAIGLAPAVGLAKVAVIPIAVPMPDGTIRPGEAAR